MSNSFMTDNRDSAPSGSVAPPLATSIPVEENSALVFAILATIQATLIFTIVMIGVPLPAIGSEFQLVQAELVLVSAAYGLPFSGLLLFGGRLTDRYSGRKMFTWGMLIFGLASLSGMFASTYWTLVAIRFLQGIGAALTAPALMALLRQLYRDVGQFNHAMATWGGVSVLGGAVGFLSSGIVTTWLSWRWMFIVPVIVSVFGLLLVRGMMKPLPVSNNDSPGLDLSGALLATCGISLFSFGLIMSGEYSWLAVPVYLPVAVGLLLIFTFMIVERHVISPLLPPGFIRNPTRMTGLIGILLAAAGMGLITFLLSLYLQQFRGWSSFATSMAFIPYTVGLLIMNRVAGALIMRFGALQITIVGLVIGAVGLLLLAQLNEQTHYAFGLLPGLFILPAGASLVFSGSAVLSTANVPLCQAGLAGGVMNTSMELGPTMGLAAFMAVAATQTNVVNGYAWAFGSAAGIYLLTAIGALILMRKINQS
ncbi:putative transmembrane efflux protein [Xenorhabdus poinarii G6]|uniref:Putative transmembrane efflux protein n=1 Tax=Xenorhabdus poinarii G6 TaxID=1354304 RepID=A0A068R632_9GAMM|nr:MFS transporter [Xenorhabdus poinarii]CDG22361.1 putative transmembrane efflux protein [Xenorhabdus poinarii G6]